MLWHAAGPCMPISNHHTQCFKSICRIEVSTFGERILRIHEFSNLILFDFVNRFICRQVFHSHQIFRFISTRTPYHSSSNEQFGLFKNMKRVRNIYFPFKVVCVQIINLDRFLAFIFIWFAYVLILDLRFSQRSPRKSVIEFYGELIFL